MTVNKTLTDEALSSSGNKGESLCGNIDSPVHETADSESVNLAVSHPISPNECRELQEPRHSAISDAVSQVAGKNCYTCQHRGGVAGSCHSSCKHPAINKHLKLLVAKWPSLTATDKQNNSAPLIKANQHGIDSGWFFWPINFDPVWLEHCLLYEEKV